jgi:hypothetical protein
MVHAYQFNVSSPQSPLTTNQTRSQTNPGVFIAPPLPPIFSGTDVFYIILALSVLVRVIVSLPDKLQK